jgi:hypothetical protein
VIQWDEKNQAVVDEMGLPVPLSVAREWSGRLTQYLTKDPDALVGLHVRILKEIHPTWVGQIEVTREDMA